MVPSFLNAGFNCGIFSILALSGPSSLSITTSPALPEIVTGAISHLNEPSAVAACARLTESIAKASCASRVKEYFAEQSSAKVPMERPLS